jgi:hypothetical protein
MAETKKDKQFFTVGGVFFLLIVIPLSLMAFLIANGMFKLGVTIKERAVNVLDQKSQEEIKIRAINTAEEVANFLNERKKDVLTATILPANDITYKQFLKENKKSIWIKDGNKIRLASVPLYTEMSLIDKTGKETIKIVDEQTLKADMLTNVSNPANTTYKAEDYFAKTKNLNKGDVYVSPVTGWYITKQEFEKGKSFSGVIRFATPVFGKEGFAGIIVLTLDYRHLSKFTNQIIPTQADQVLKAEASTGNYAYMVDNRGFVIVHPNDFHIEGSAPEGSPIPPLTETTATDLTKKGEEVINFNFMGYIDPNLPVIAKDAAAGNSGTKNYKFGGHTIFVAYSPIKFYAASYPAPTGFGWVGMGIDVEKYNESAIKASKNIDKEAKAWTATIIFILIASMIILFLIMWLLVRGINRSLLAEIPEGSQQPKAFDDDDDDDDDK